MNTASSENMAWLGRESFRSTSGSTLPSVPAAASVNTCSGETMLAAMTIVAINPLATVPTAICVVKLAMSCPLVALACGGAHAGTRQTDSGGRESARARKLWIVEAAGARPLPLRRKKIGTGSPDKRPDRKSGARRSGAFTGW